MDGGDGALEEVVSVITALKWIPRSFCLGQPIVYELSQAERNLLVEKAKIEDKEVKTNDNIEEEDNEEDIEEEDEDLPLSQLQDMQLNEDRIEQEINEDADSDLGSDAEDHNLKISDKILVTASVEEDQASLEIHAYDTETGSFYVHHDIALPAYPLCIEWLGVQGKQLNWTETESESFVAVGMFSPEIEIWTLDVLDALEPNCKLVGHSDAVMCLSWNSKHPHLLASGGADRTIRLWDLQSSECARVFSDLHTDKVQSMQWNPAEATVLLAGSFDHSISVFDARDPLKVAKYFSPGNSDVESVCWDFHNPVIFGVSTESGIVSFVDVRAGPSAPPLFSFQAHEKACSSLCGNARVPGLYATCSVDKTVKIWDLQEELAGSSPSSVTNTESAAKPKKKTSSKKLTLKEKAPLVTKRMKVGKLFAGHFAANVDDESFLDSDPFLIACGGSKGAVALWHIGGTDDEDDEEIVKKKFDSRVLPLPKNW